MSGGGLIQKSRGEAKPFLFVLAAVAALGGFLFGYDTGVISGALLFIKPAFHASTLQQQAIIGSLLVGAVVGAAASGYLAEALSRKWTKVLSGCIYVAAALWSAFASGATELIAARFVLGLSVGTASFVAPMYIAEVAPRQIRGGLVSFNQMMVVLGILIAYIVDFAFKGVADNWRWMLGLGAVPGVALAVGMVLMPHSPRWLMERGRDQEARAVLKRVHRHEEGVESEMDDIRHVVADEGSLRDIIGAKVRPMLIVGLALAIFQQIVGINTVIYYAPTILRFTGSSVSSAITQTVFIGLTNVVFTLVAVLLLDRFGRRVFLLLGTVGLIVSLVVLGVFSRLAWRAPCRSRSGTDRADRLHRELRDRTGPGLLADDLRDLPAASAKPCDGVLHDHELGVQLPGLVHLPLRGGRARKDRNVSALRHPRSDRTALLRDARPGDERTQPRADRATTPTQAPAQDLGPRQRSSCRDSHRSQAKGSDPGVSLHLVGSRAAITPKCAFARARR